LWESPVQKFAEKRGALFPVKKPCGFPLLSPPAEREKQPESRPKAALFHRFHRIYCYSYYLNKKFYNEGTRYEDYVSQKYASRGHLSDDGNGLDKKHHYRH
jgi:hypothetical protein